MSKASTHRSAADIKVLRRCGNRAVQLAEAGLKQPTSATSKVVSAETVAPWFYALSPVKRKRQRRCRRGF
jgi:hypothetical protein